MRQGQPGQALRQTLNRAGLNKAINDLAKAILSDRGLDSSQRLVAVEEALAELNAADETGNYDQIQRRYGVTVPEGMKKGVRGHIARFVEAVKNVLSKVLGREVTNDAEVWSILRQAREGYDAQSGQAEGEVAASVTQDEAAQQFKETAKAYGGKEAWKKARDSGTTKLNYNQWVQVRTPNFKRWFGDWQALKRQTAARAMIDRALSDNTWQQRTMIAEGFDADPSGKLSETFGFEVRKQYLTPDDIRKSDKRHGEGRERNRDQIGLTHDDYVKALEVLRDPETYKNTVSNNGKPSAEFGRRFEDGTLVVAEVETAEDGAVSIKSIWKRTPGRNHAGATPYPIRTPESAAGVASILHSDSLLVNPDTVSKAIDPTTGEPLVVYHGTDKDFVRFDRGKQGNFTYGDNPDAGGIFFVENPAHAEYYIERRGKGTAVDGGNIMPAFLAIRKLKTIDAPSVGLLSGQAKMLRKAEQEGHDGAFMLDQWVVFRPEQVKSATGNTGDFSAETADIRYSLSPAEETYLPSTGLPMREFYNRKKCFQASTIQNC